MKDMFGRELNKWDVVVQSDYNGEMFMSVVTGDFLSSGWPSLRDIKKEYDSDGNLILGNCNLGEEYPALYYSFALLSVPTEIKIKLDTMKFAGETL